MTGWQRIKRRVSLWGGSYVHPDGTLELDFDEKAGIDRRRESVEVQQAKLDRYMAVQARKERRLGALFLAGAAFLPALHIGMPTWQAVVVAGLVWLGVSTIIR